jgi:hypothetical protein
VRRAKLGLVSSKVAAARPARLRCLYVAPASLEIDN